LPFVGEQEAARQPAEQGNAEAALEAFHLMAHRRLRHVQFFRGAREAEPARGRFEGSERVQREGDTGHGDGLVFLGHHTREDRLWPAQIGTNLRMTIR